MHLVLAAAEILRKSGTKVRVVNMACFELFDSQPAAYKNRVLPPAVEKRIAVEAGATLGWYKYVGLKGRGDRDRPFWRISTSKGPV